VDGNVFHFNNEIISKTPFKYSSNSPLTRRARKSAVICLTCNPLLNRENPELDQDLHYWRIVL